MLNSKKKYCLNCGHEAHEGKLHRTEIDYDGREYQIVVCEHPRYEIIWADDYPDGYSTLWRKSEDK